MAGNTREVPGNLGIVTGFPLQSALFLVVQPLQLLLKAFSFGVITLLCCHECTPLSVKQVHCYSAE